MTILHMMKELNTPSINITRQGPLTCDSLELRTQELDKVVNDLNHRNDVIADFNHAVGAGKQQLLGELPSGITTTDLNLLADLQFYTFIKRTSQIFI